MKNLRLFIYLACIQGKDRDALFPSQATARLILCGLAFVFALSSTAVSAPRLVVAGHGFPEAEHSRVKEWLTGVFSLPEN